MPKTLCFDLDGTLCSNTFGQYESAEPFPWAVARVNSLAGAGHHIVIFTARGSATGIDWGERTREQLASWGVRYDALVFGKPPADVYVDDRAVHTDAWHAAGAFSLPACDDVPAHVSRVFEAGRTFLGRPLGLKEHVSRARALAAAAGIRTTIDPTPLAGRVRASLDARPPTPPNEIVYVLTLASWRSAAHLDVTTPYASASVGVAFRGLDEVAQGLAPMVAPGADDVCVLARISATPDPPGAWPLCRAADGSIVDGLGGQLGVVTGGALRLQPQAGPTSVAAIWLRALAAAQDVQVAEAPITDADLIEADEVLIAGLPFCLLPVVSVDGLRAGDGRSGALTRRLLDAWSAEVGVDLAAQTAELVGRTRTDALVP
jgi:branched-subunit amino acid aminotransferase/4-amino-4-deoxychorismate lyase